MKLPTIELISTLFTSNFSLDDKMKIILETSLNFTNSEAIIIVTFNNDNSIKEYYTTSKPTHHCHLSQKQIFSQLEKTTEIYTANHPNQIISTYLNFDEIDMIYSIPISKNEINGFIISEWKKEINIQKFETFFYILSLLLAQSFFQSLQKEKLNDNESVFQTLQNLVSDAIFWFTTDGLCTNYKPFKGERTTPDKVIGKSISELFMKETADLINSYIQRTCETGHSITFAYQSVHHGTNKFYSAKISPISYNEIILLVDDVSEEVNYRQKDIFINHLTDNIYDGVLSFDLSFNITYANKAALQQYGYKKNEIIQKCFFDLLPTNDVESLKNEIIENVNKNGFWTGNVSGKRKDESFFISELKVTPLYNQSSDEKGSFVCVERDVTENKQAEIDLIWAKEAAEAGNRAKSEFLANMSHEIRTPLNSIIGFTQIMIEDEIDVSKKDMLNIINTSGLNLLHIINDILDLSRIESGNVIIDPKSFNINDFINNLREQFQYIAKEKKIDFIITIDIQSKNNILLDELRVYQILNNLIGNAFKFTNAGSISLNCVKNSECIIFTITDTGIGIDRSKLDDIFKPFYQTDSSITRDFGGNGLGLAITYRLVHLMNGTINVQSSKNSGTTFIVEIPYLKEETLVVKRKAPDITNGMYERWIDNCDNDKYIKCVIKESLNKFLILSKEINKAFINKSFESIKKNIYEIKEFSGNCGLTEIYELFILMDEEINKELVDSSIFSSYIETMNIFASKIPDDILESTEKEIPLKILMADDNIINQKLVAVLLKHMNVTCDFVGNGKEALDKLRIVNYDVLILDMQMPVMSGEDLLKIIKTDESLKDVHVIIFTAYAINGDKEKFIEMGGDDYISKPLDKDIFRNKISKLMEHKKYLYNQLTTK